MAGSAEMHRVVVTGMAGVCAFGKTWREVRNAFDTKRNAVRAMPEWDRYTDLIARIAAPIDNFQPPSHWNRKQLRSMGRVAQFSVHAAELALTQAGLNNDPLLTSGQLGVACGSSVGSTPAIAEFTAMYLNGGARTVNANSYVRMMPHTTAANIGVYFGISGRVIPTSSACTSGSQGIGYAYEAIRFGRQVAMIAGGAEELCATQAMNFDLLYAASRCNAEPHRTPRPYDKERDGLVIGEGAAMLVLEEMEHAKARGANILAEIVGFASNSDGVHMTRPEERTMQAVMELALADAQLTPSAIDYVNGHGTATEQGDLAETRATHRVFGSRMPISSQKSLLGHTLGACGALEAWFTIEMMNSSWFAPTLNLETIDTDCGELDYISGEGRNIEAEFAMTNNFAFGGVNTSLIFRRTT